MPSGRDDERPRPLRDVAALRVARQTRPARRAQKALRELRADVLLGGAALEADGVVALTLGVAEAVERDAPLAAEVERRLGAVLEDRDHVRPRLAELLVVLAQLDELLAAERSAEVAHERHHERPVAPALRERDVSLARLERQIGERVAGLQRHDDELIGFPAVRPEGAGAIVAGGASGLGEATARALHERGAHVTIADLNQEKGEALAAELGERAAFVPCDVTDEEQVRPRSRRPPPRAGCGSASAAPGVGWAERTASKRGPHQLLPFETVIRVNLIGTFNVLRFAAAAMNDNEPLDDGERGRVRQHRLDRGLRRPDRADRLLGVEGRDRRADAARGARPRRPRHSRRARSRPGTFDTPLLGALPQEARDELGQAIPFPQRLGQPAEFAALALHIVENQMLNGETIRLDGALRMPPR